MNKSGFEIGDKFVYFSKYGGVTLGVVEKIFPVIELIGRVYTFKYYINGMYTSNELHHYDRLADAEEMNSLESVRKYAEYRKKQIGNDLDWNDYSHT